MSHVTTVGPTATAERPRWLSAATWILIATALGFVVPEIFSSMLRWDRALFLLPYGMVVGVFLLLYARRQGIGWRDLVPAWGWGVAGAVIVGAFVVSNVYTQPGSAAPEGLYLVWALFWFGLVYGAVDALFLNVFPVLAVQGPRFRDRHRSWPAIAISGALAVAASILITAAYHLGFDEYRNATLFAPILGNTILTLSYVLTRSPIAPVAAHVAMHMAGVLHGMETVAQLPPHY